MRSRHRHAQQRRQLTSQSERTGPFRSADVIKPAQVAIGRPQQEFRQIGGQNRRGMCRHPSTGGSDAVRGAIARYVRPDPAQLPPAPSHRHGFAPPARRRPSKSVRIARWSWLPHASTWSARLLRGTFSGPRTPHRWKGRSISLSSARPPPADFRPPGALAARPDRWPANPSSNRRQRASVDQPIGFGLLDRRGKLTTIAAPHVTRRNGFAIDASVKRNSENFTTILQRLGNARAGKRVDAHNDKFVHCLSLHASWIAWSFRWERPSLDANSRGLQSQRAGSTPTSLQAGADCSQSVAVGPRRVVREKTRRPGLQSLEFGRFLGRIGARAMVWRLRHAQRRLGTRRQRPRPAASTRHRATTRPDRG